MAEGTPREFVTQIHEELNRRYGPVIGGKLFDRPEGLTLRLHPDVERWLLCDRWVADHIVRSVTTMAGTGWLGELFPYCSVVTDRTAEPGFWQVEVVTVEPMWGGKVDTHG